MTRRNACIVPVADNQRGSSRGLHDIHPAIRRRGRGRVEPGALADTRRRHRGHRSSGEGRNRLVGRHEQAVDQLRKATASAKEVSVEFGVNISGKTGIVLVEGTVAANLKVVLKW
jgi:hypothetical protein